VLPAHDRNGAAVRVAVELDVDGRAPACRQLGDRLVRYDDPRLAA
jgi:hypothetical protein